MYRPLRVAAKGVIQHDCLEPLMDESYTAEHPIRMVTAASLFDGHDAAINIMRRILQSSGAEVIHLGHNRTVGDVVTAAIQEDAQGIAISSYQGGHMEYFKYMHDLLHERGAGHIRLFGGGGGVIVPDEIAELEAYGITKIFSPDDGMDMGLQGMIDVMLRECDFPIGQSHNGAAGPASRSNHLALARLLSTVEQGHAQTVVGHENAGAVAERMASSFDNPARTRASSSSCRPKPAIIKGFGVSVPAKIGTPRIANSTSKKRCALRKSCASEL